MININVKSVTNSFTAPIPNIKRNCTPNLVTLAQLLQEIQHNSENAIKGQKSRSLAAPSLLIQEKLTYCKEASLRSILTLGQRSN